MNTPRILSLTFLALALGAVPPALAAPGDGGVQLLRTPNGGIQPQAAVDERGGVHLIYLKGEPGKADIFYVRREREQSGFSSPIRVNSLPGTAVAVGTIRGAQLAVGKGGRVHVAWNGPHVPGKPPPPAPTFYTRLNDAGTAFEPQRNLMTWTTGLDGGGSVAADKQGNVYVTWHGREKSQSAHEERRAGEASRAVFVACSRDEGRTFGRETQANAEPTGACGCCGMKVFADRSGNIYALYRMATQVLNRDMVLLASRDGGASFTGLKAQAWKIGTCPMSSASLTQAPDSVLAAWETNGQVYFAKVAPGTTRLSPPIAPPGTGKRKHPVVVANASGETLLAWVEGTGWQKGGGLAWQKFDPAGRPVGELGQADGVPVWGLSTAFVQPDGRFVIVY